MTNAHLASLAAKHAELEAILAREGQRPIPDTVAITRLKREKLRLKEQLSQVN